VITANKEATTTKPVPKTRPYIMNPLSGKNHIEKIAVSIEAIVRVRVVLISYPLLVLFLILQ
jgi:hypothetical protein